MQTKLHDNVLMGLLYSGSSFGVEAVRFCDELFSRSNGSGVEVPVVEAVSGTKVPEFRSSTLVSFFILSSASPREILVL